MMRSRHEPDELDYAFNRSFVGVRDLTSESFVAKASKLASPSARPDFLGAKSCIGRLAVRRRRRCECALSASARMPCARSVAGDAFAVEPTGARRRDGRERQERAGEILRRRRRARTILGTVTDLRCRERPSWEAAPWRALRALAGHPRSERRRSASPRRDGSSSPDARSARRPSRKLRRRSPVRRISGSSLHVGDATSRTDR